jgi:hypothetical protein
VAQPRSRRDSCDLQMGRDMARPPCTRRSGYRTCRMRCFALLTGPPVRGRSPSWRTGMTERRTPSGVCTADVLPGTGSQRSRPRCWCKSALLTPRTGHGWARHHRRNLTCRASGLPAQGGACLAGHRHTLPRRPRPSTTRMGIRTHRYERTVTGPVLAFLPGATFVNSLRNQFRSRRGPNSFVCRPPGRSPVGRNSVPSAKHAGRISGLVPSVQSEESRELWRAVLAGDPQALSDHSPEWVDAICSGGPLVRSDRSRSGDGAARYRWPGARSNPARSSSA